MTDASNPQPPTLKRARFSNETELNKTPNAAGRLAASIGIVTLHPTLKRIAEFHLNKFMKLYTQQVKQEENIEKKLLTQSVKSLFSPLWGFSTRRLDRNEGSFWVIPVRTKRKHRKKKRHKVSKVFLPAFGLFK